MKLGVIVVFLVVTLAAASAGAGWAQEPPDANAGDEPLTWGEFRQVPAAEPELRLRWGPEAAQMGELHLPDANGPHPVIVLIHGGCWLSIADTGYMSHLARALREAGWAVWAPEFRRVDMPGGAWPGILQDVAAGTDHLRVLALEHPLDLDRVVLMGHSSGGHLALWLAGRQALGTSGDEGLLRGADPLPVRGVVGLSAIAGVADYHARGGGGCGPGAVPAFLGDDPDLVPERLRVAEPGARMVSGMPVLLATGELDAVVPLAHAQAFAADMDAGVRVLPVVDAGHFEVVAPWTPPFARMWRSLEPFLREATRSYSDEGQR